MSNKQKPRDIRRKYSRLDRPSDDATFTTCGTGDPDRGNDSPLEGNETMKTLDYMQARRGSDGRYRIYYRGTANEAAPGHSFTTAAAARRHAAARAAVIDGHREIGSDAAIEVENFDRLTTAQLNDELAYIADYQG